MSDVLIEKPAECLAPLVSLTTALAAEGIVPASINVEWRYTNQTHPYLNVWLRYRTEFERLANRLGLRIQSAIRMADSRSYWTKGDGPGVLLQCLSQRHHDDYERPT